MGEHGLDGSLIISGSVIGTGNGQLDLVGNIFRFICFQVSGTFCARDTEFFHNGTKFYQESFILRFQFYGAAKKRQSLGFAAEMIKVYQRKVAERNVEFRQFFGCQFKHFGSFGIASFVI